MTNIVSSISGQFGRALIFGMFLPTAVFAILFRVIVYPLIPQDSEILSTLRSLDTEWEIVAVSLLAVLLSALLFVLNGPIIRMYEGYPWKDGLIGSILTGSEFARLERVYAQRKALLPLAREANRINNHELKDWVDQIYALRNAVGEIYNKEFPMPARLVLPTRLGNVIRSFETYSTRRYGMEAITLWPRLIAKIDERYSGAIDEAKTLFDFMLNASFLSGLFGVTMAVAGALRAEKVETQELWKVDGPLIWLTGIAGAFLLSYFCYRRAIREATGWGDMVASAFDLYRGDLLKSLGHQDVPTTVAEERTLWTGISDWLQREDRPFVADQRYSPLAAPAVQCKPTEWPAAAIELEMHRGVDEPRADATIAVRIRVINKDKKRPAQSVCVIDSVPDGFDYLWDSARATVGSRTWTVAASGTNPISFDLGDLEPNSKASLSYRIVKRA